ncbi:m7GpppX diphosphatase [Halyomorpha halys]|uniref:m7GpppX diphosphatase n=1 Tax=Halyomorpha halys TaxID=286706 RepID=UPI0006D528AF|nr:m7GpppX diphosphatase [Halyomorpha halys]
MVYWNSRLLYKIPHCRSLPRNIFKWKYQRIRSVMSGVTEENNTNCEINDKHKSISDLSNFIFKRVLCDFGQRKTICVEGSFSDREGKAVIWLEKTPFSEELVKKLSTSKSILNKEFLNDVYGSYSCQVDPDLNALKTTIIYPATEQHINKFEEKPIYLIEETKQLYETITLPHINQEQFDLTWVYNVLDHKKETERIVFEDSDPLTGFVLIPDLKWNGKQTEDLYLLALIKRRGIKSLRDLRGEHLPLLKNILSKGVNAIFEKYNISRNQLRIFIHYQPTFYHLHVHFTYLKFEAPGIFAEKSHILSTVINNLELRSDYYEQSTLPFVISEGQNLCLEYMRKGIVSSPC